ncbi:LacI family DNA-binding transcriptional regulator [Isoptericola sp. AK164]|uniref:LacI family DNA-binding transcriptional regulator n=1 Tax=Isoptericola sp. AK164 TaxID=3024246 RepID=UPI00241880A6|nr:LacI family DNA-binding transcriptional regulator [Isoptericola sp. AK164]
MAVTRNDVARAAGVSSAVVSYVLNDGPRPVSAATRRKVLEAIDRLGYRRDNLARSMRTGKTDSIGLILPDIALSYFAVMTQRVTELARSRGLSVVIKTSNGRSEREREHVAELAARRVDGIVLMSVDPLDETRWAAEFELPVLIVDRPEVAIDGTALAARHLIEHGCRRLARIAAPTRYSITPRRDTGWNSALAEAGIGSSTVLRADVSEDGGRTAGLELLAGAERPDGLLVDSGPQALGFLRAAADVGVRVPQDLAVVAAEVGEAGRFSIPRLSSVDSPIEEIAARAVDQIGSATRQDRILRLTDSTYALHERESCGHG